MKKFIYVLLITALSIISVNVLSTNIVNAQNRTRIFSDFINIPVLVSNNSNFGYNYYHKHINCKNLKNPTIRLYQDIVKIGYIPCPICTRPIPPMPVPIPTPIPNTPTPNNCDCTDANPEVYFTKEGSVYHKDKNCSSITNRKYEFISVCESEAKNGGYPPCSRCASNKDLITVKVEY